MPRLTSLAKVAAETMCIIIINIIINFIIIWLYMFLLSTFFHSPFALTSTPSLHSPSIRTSGEVINSTSDNDNSHHCTKTTGPILLDKGSDGATTELSALWEGIGGSMF